MEKHEIPSLCDLLSKFNTAMLITRAGDHDLRARPMAIVSTETSGRLWFISSRHSAKVHEIENDTHVHVACQTADTYLSINGLASLIDDPGKVEEFWEESLRMWVPGGKEDTEIVLIAVTPKNVEYWDHPANPSLYSGSSENFFVHGTKPEAS
jgi:general stress protein 26